MPTLTWAGKESATKDAKSIPYRLLELDESLCYGDRKTGNVIVQGDNLAALKALMPYYRGRVRCIYIDPPYNTGAAFEHYDDNVAHGTWLSLMYPRLELLRDFLTEDGSIWISIDDTECHYLKVICDEIFGRQNFITSIVWQSRYSRSNDAIISVSHNHILVYAIAPDKWKLARNRLPRTEAQAKQYKNPDNDPNGPWRAIPWDAPNIRPNLTYPITNLKGIVKLPPTGRCWSRTQDQWEEIVASGKAYFGKNGDGAPSYKAYLKEAPPIVPNTWWEHTEFGHTDEAKKEIASLFGRDNVFETPKPARLIEKVLQIATNPGDLVLDSFLGSGTTAAVAQKMNRQYIGIEIGEHAVTHVVPRLRKVIDGEEGGISKAENWQGGGGFSFYRLGEEVFTADGQIRRGVKFQTLAAHLWMESTGTPYGTGKAKESGIVQETMAGYGKDSPLLGIHDGVAYYLLYNGILGDKRPNGGNVLTKKVLALLPPYHGPRVIYGESSRLHEETLKTMGIVFRQTPKEIPSS